MDCRYTVLPNLNRAQEGKTKRTERPRVTATITSSQANHKRAAMAIYARTHLAAPPGGPRQTSVVSIFQFYLVYPSDKPTFIHSPHHQHMTRHVNVQSLSARRAPSFRQPSVYMYRTGLLTFRMAPHVHTAARCRCRSLYCEKEARACDTRSRAASRANLTIPSAGMGARTAPLVSSLP